MKKIIIVAAIVSALGVVGYMDCQDEQTEEQHYCEMVKEKAWPAYRLDVDCGK